MLRLALLRGRKEERAYRPHIFAVTLAVHFGSEARVSFRVLRGARTQGEGRRGGVWISCKGQRWLKKLKEQKSIFEKLKI